MPGKSHRQRNLRATVHGVAKSGTQLKPLSTHTHRALMGCRGVTVEVPDLKRQLNCYRIYGCCSTPVHCLTLPFCHHSHHKVPSFLTPPPLSHLRINKKRKRKDFVQNKYFSNFIMDPQVSSMPRNKENVDRTCLSFNHVQMCVYECALFTICNFLHSIAHVYSLFSMN